MPAIPVSTTAPAKDRVHLRELDWLMLVTVSLSCLGLVMAVSVVGARVEVGPLVAVKQQSFKLLFGLAAFLTAAVLPMRLLCRLAVPLFFVTTALCLVPHLLPDVNGAHRWIRYGDHQFQPVEPARFFLILTVALLLAPNPERARAGGGALRALGCALLLGGVLMSQPDNGNALLVMAIASLLTLIAGVRMAFFLPLLGVGVAAFAFVALRHGYVRDRLSDFLTPAPDSQVGLGLIAVGSGGATGRGLGQGWMKMGFVPEAQNDFVFAIVGEELGFVGTAAVLLGFGAFGFIAWRLATKVRDPFLRYVVCGYALTICLQAAANLLVVSGWAPAKGIDLPFVSTGGTSLVFCFAAVGLIGNAARTDAAWSGRSVGFTTS